MKIMTERDYDKMSKQEQDVHHQKIRDELIEKGMIKPKEEAQDNL